MVSIYFKEARPHHYAIIRRKKKGLKYGIKVPEMAAEAHRLDQENGNTFWTDTIAKKMNNVTKIEKEKNGPFPQFIYFIINHDRHHV